MDDDLDATGENVDYAGGERPKVPKPVRTVYTGGPLLRLAPPEQINTVLQENEETAYSLAKAMGCGDSDTKRLRRYLKGESDLLPMGGLKRISEALSELCHKAIRITE